MPADRISIPVKTVDGDNWAQLNHFGNTHFFTGEDCRTKKENFSFAGGHRVRLYVIKNNVHWKIPAGVTLDITDVTPAAPRRREA